MGNVPVILQEALSDITEEGNVWKDDQTAIPTDYFDDGEPTVPSLWVAPSAPSRSTNLRRFEAARGRERAIRRPAFPSPREAEAQSEAEELTSWIRQESPVQFVWQPGLEDGPSGSGTRGMRHDKLKYSWEPLEKCKILAGRVLLTEARLRALHPHLPVVTRLASSWRLVYSPMVHGVSLRTFYRQCRAWPGETLVLMEDALGATFGGFASHTWRETRVPHFGMPECFVYAFDGKDGLDEEGHALTVFPWTGRNSCFMHADLHGFSMGGGRDDSSAAPGFAFWIAEDFLHGTSAPSPTFGTKAPLASGPEFILRRFECWAFDHGMGAHSTTDIGAADALASGGASLPDTASVRNSAVREEAERLRQCGSTQ